jgi:uncharacterized protein YfaS (alpha-2-macroglobulin family)
MGTFKKGIPLKAIPSCKINFMKMALMLMLPTAAFAEKLTVNLYEERICGTIPLRCVFSEPMIPMGFHSDSVPQGVSLTPQVRGKWSWNSQNALQFSPDSEWHPGNRYQVSISAGVSSKISGNRLKHDWQKTVSVGSFSGSFVNSRDERSTESFIELRFKLPVHPDTLRKHLTCTCKSLVLNTSDSTGYHIRPKTGWREGDKITLSIDTGLTPIDGNMHLESAQTTCFLVSDTIKFLGLYRNEKKVSLSDSLFLEDQYELRFSHPLNYDAIEDYALVNGVQSGLNSYSSTIIDVNELIDSVKSTTLLLKAGLPSIDSAYLFNDMQFVFVGDSNRVDPALPSFTIKEILAEYNERDSIPSQPLSLEKPVRILPAMNFDCIVKCHDTSSENSWYGRVYCRTPDGIDTLNVIGHYFCPRNLPSNANCTLIVKAGFRIGGYQLKKDYLTIFRTSDYVLPQSCEPVIYDWSGGYYRRDRAYHVMLPQAAAIPLKRYGTPRIVTALRPVTKNEQLLSDTSADSLLQSWRTDTIPDPPPGTDWYDFIPVPLAPVLSAGKYGAADVKLSVDSKEYEDLGRYVLTDLGIQLLKFRLSTAVAVTSLSKRTPVYGAHVTLTGKQDSVLIRGETDSLGFFQVPHALAPNFVIVSIKDDTLVYKTENLSFTNTAVCGGRIITERELYRPGDTLYFKGIVRLLRDRWDPLNADSAVVTINWDGARQFIDTLPFSGCGSFSGTVVVPLEVAQQTYEIKAELFHAKGLVRGGFRVSEFRFAELTAAIDEGIVGKDSVQFTVSAKWLHGGVAGRSPFTWKMQIQTNSDAWPEVEDVSDNTESWYYHGDSMNSREKMILVDGSAVLDSTGKATVAFERLPYDSGTTYQFSAIVKGSPVQSATAPGKQITIPPKFRLFVGIQGSTMLFKGDTVPLLLKTVREDGQPVAGVVLTTDIIRNIPIRRYEKNRFGLPAVIRDTNHTRVRFINPVTDSLGIVRLSTETLSEGNYTIFIRPQTSLVKKPYTYEFTVSVPDTTIQNSEEDDYYYDDYYHESASNGFSISELDSGIHSVGDKVRYQIKAPQDSCTILLTVSRENLYEHTWISMAGRDTIITITFRDEHIPIVRIKAVFYKPLHKTSKGALSFEQKHLLATVSVTTEVSSEYRRIPVTVTTGKETYSPGDTVTVQVKVPPKSASATALVMVVDEGVLQLGNPAVPDIMQVFTTKQDNIYNCCYNECSIRNFYGPFDYDSCNALRIRPKFSGIDELIGGLMGGDGGGSLDLKKRGSIKLGAGLSLRTPLLPCAYFNPEVKFNTDGTALCSFKLPGNLTRWRATAIVDDTTTFGADMTNFNSNKPLMIRPQIPRFLRTGDSASATCIVENYSKSSRQITSGVVVHGDTVIDTFSLHNDEMHLCRFPLIGGATGTDSLLFLASSDSLSDGVKLGLPVMYERPCDIAAIGGSTVDSTRIPIILPEATTIDSGMLDLSLSTTRMQNLAEGVKYLFDYPYGCLEQRSSRIMPLLILGDFARRFHLTMLKKGDELIAIQEYLDHIRDFQNKTDGGLGYWPSDSGNSSSWLTAFVLEIMTKAKMCGFAFNDSVHTKAINYLTKQIHLKDSSDRIYFTNSYFQLVMALSGKPDRAALKRLYNERNNLSLSCQINLLRAMYAAGRFKRKVSALQKQLQHGLVEKDRLAYYTPDKSKGFEFCHESPVRQTALALEALLETGCKSRFDEPMIRWLTEQRRVGRWRTTQENMAVFRAFAAYTTVYERDFPKLDATVSVSGSDWFSAKLEGREGIVAQSSRSLDSITTHGKTDVSLSHSGSGRLYWDLKMSTFPSGKAPPVSSGFSITRTIVPIKKDNTDQSDSSYLEVGRLMKVTVTVRCNQDITFVAINDPVPAGCEAINPELLGGEQETARKNTLWQGPSELSHNEFRDSRVLLFIDNMSSGEYQFSYVIKPITSGKFLWPAPLVEAMYYPEFYGRGVETTVTIVEKK